MTPKEPVRFAELASDPVLSETLRAARARLPDDDAVVRIAVGIGFSPSGVAPKPSSELAVGGNAASVGALKIVGALLLASAAGGGLWAALSHRSMAPALPPAPAPAIEPIRRLEVTDTEPIPATAQVPYASPTSPAVGSGAVAMKPSELDLVGKAESILRSDPARALALCERHRRLYPTGELLEEREVLVVEALAALGRRDEARQRAEAFRKSYPASPYSGRIRRAIGTESARGASEEPPKNPPEEH